MLRFGATVKDVSYSAAVIRSFYTIDDFITSANARPLPEGMQTVRATVVVRRVERVSLGAPVCPAAAVAAKPT